MGQVFPGPFSRQILLCMHGDGPKMELREGFEAVVRR
ncbi:hypothetical protein DFR75_10850 [Nocardia ignorata]|uniref:Uncharacterized protein n=1 Tax=Nocardia ignorata TaxID=145285 RepID=A0A4R6P2F6_NOCIG|nr:hypothetical protein DFR75_10850 [Nocardia ignorata]